MTNPFKVGDVVKRIAPDSRTVPKMIHNGRYEVDLISRWRPDCISLKEIPFLWKYDEFVLEQTSAFNKLMKLASDTVNSPTLKECLAGDHYETFKASRRPIQDSKCDCGGWKTYQSMSPESHSSWCCSQTKVL